MRIGSFSLFLAYSIKWCRIRSHLPTRPCARKRGGSDRKPEISIYARGSAAPSFDRYQIGNLARTSDRIFPVEKVTLSQLAFKSWAAVHCSMRRHPFAVPE